MGFTVLSLAFRRIGGELRGHKGGGPGIFLGMIFIPCFLRAERHFCFFLSFPGLHNFGGCSVMEVQYDTIP